MSLSNSIINCSCLVVGSGPGGLTAAKRLVEAGFDTILIEEKDFTPTSISQNYKNYHKMNKLWRNGGITTSFGKLGVLYAEGSTFGGGAEINSGIMQRVHHEVVESWTKNNNLKNFSIQDLNPYYDKVFNIVQPTIPEPHPSSEVLLNAGSKLGWASERVEVAFDKNGKKNSVSELYLKTLLEKGLRVITNVKAQKIIYKNKKATSVVCLFSGNSSSDSKSSNNVFYNNSNSQNQPSKPRKVIIKFDNLFLAGGAVYSPFLLLNSGITKNIGQTLQFHPTVKVGALFNEPINKNPLPVPGSAITQFMPNIRIGGSVFTKGFFTMFLSEDWQERNWMFNHHEHCGVYYAMIKPEGVAKITKLPFFKDPIVKINLTPKDKEMLKKALNRLTEAVFAAGAKYVYSSVFGSNLLSHYCDSHFNFKNLNLMTIHMFSSLPMGEMNHNPVDSYGRLKALNNVLVCDASIIPSAPGTNPQATIMALVERNMDFFINDTKHT